MLVPLAEHFHSLQGEGAYAGLPMHFLRLPGCNVGKPQTPIDQRNDVFPVLLPNKAQAKVCHTYNGEAFFCDTDFDKHSESTVQELLAETWEDAMCLTGGEPLLWQSKEWFRHLVQWAQCEIHLETSGTIVPEPPMFDWITVSPKQGWLPEAVACADQLKFLVTKDTQMENLMKIVHYASPGCRLLLSPIFDPNELVQEHLARALELQKMQPTWRLSVQLHKWLGLR